MAERVRAKNIESIVKPIPKIYETFNHGMFEIVPTEDEYAAQLKISDHRRDWWFLYKLRDRDTDGPDWQPSPLNQWPNRHPDDVFPHGRAVEESKYWLDPHHPLDERYSQQDAQFIENPFEAIPFENPTVENVRDWYQRFTQIVKDPNAPYPGYYCAKSLQGMSEPVLDRTLEALRELGYDFITAVPTWFHVAKQYTEKLGFSYVFPNDKKRIEEISDKLPQTTKRDKVVASWVVIAQFVNELVEQQGGKPEDFIDERAVLRRFDGTILTYPLTPERNLWVAKKV